MAAKTQTSDVQNPVTDDAPFVVEKLTVTETVPERVGPDGKPVKEPNYIGNDVAGNDGWDLNDAVHYYCDLIEAASSSSAELEAALQRLRDLSSYEQYRQAPLDPYAGEAA